MRHLFLDNINIAELNNIQRIPHQAKRHPEPVFTPKYPWETIRLQMYGNCILFNKETKRYQMFYLACGGDGGHYPNHIVGGKRKAGHVTLPALADSKDGIHWEHYMTSTVSYNDILVTNILDLHEGQSFEAGILYDEQERDPSKRYKAFIWDQIFARPVEGREEHLREGTKTEVNVFDDNNNIIYNEPYQEYGIRIAFSRDGIHWEKKPGWAIRCYSDTGQSPLYDPQSGQYVAFGRFNRGTFTSSDVTYGNHTGKEFNIGRSVGRVTSSDFINWSQPELVLSADNEDPESLQINSMPTSIYEGVYLGIMELDQRPLPGNLGPQLATSRDGKHWTRVERTSCIEATSKNSWDYFEPCPEGGIRPAGQLITTNDEVRFYYSASYSSGAGTNEERIKKTKHLIGVGMASWRRDGFVSLSAGTAEGEILTKPFILKGPELHLNLNAEKGYAKIQVCDMQGRPYLKGKSWEHNSGSENFYAESWNVSNYSNPITGNHLDSKVIWDNDDLEHRVGKPITLRIKLKNADLYSFWS